MWLISLNITCFHLKFLREDFVLVNYSWSTSLAREDLSLKTLQYGTGCTGFPNTPFSAPVEGLSGSGWIHTHNTLKVNISYMFQILLATWSGRTCTWGPIWLLRETCLNVVWPALPNLSHCDCLGGCEVRIQCETLNVFASKISSEKNRLVLQLSPIILNKQERLTLLPCIGRSATAKWAWDG